MKKNKLSLVLSIIVLVFFVGCELSEDKKRTGENPDGADHSTDIYSLIDDTTHDSGDGSESFVAVFEKLITPYTYKHFCQGDYSVTENAWKVCLATSYMIAKGILYNSPVDNSTLDKIVKGGIVPTASITDGIKYAKNDLVTSCVVDISTQNSNISGAFTKIYETINKGYPIFALININSAGRNSTTINPNAKTGHRHWVLIVGIKIEDFGTRKGEILVIDPAHGTRNIKSYGIEDFLSSALLASTSNTINQFCIGSQDDAISSNYLLVNIPELLFPTNNMTNISSPINFSWKAISGNPEYRIKISTSLNSWTADNGFSDTETNGDKNTGSTNSYSWNNAQYNMTYYWSVKSFVNGASSKYSQPFKFTTSNNIAVTRIISLSSSLNYGNVYVGQTSDKTLTISNTGNSNLTVNSISVPNCYSVVGSQSFNISAGQTTNATICFSPQSATSYNGNITVNANHTSGSNTISISGSGIPVVADTRIINLGGELNYGNVYVGQTSDKTLTISNTGNSTLTVNSISVPSGYSVVGSQSFSISAGQSTNSTIRFSPQNATSYNGNINVNANHTSGSNIISISGSGISQTPSYTVTPNQGSYTQLPSSNKTGSCSANPYLGDNIIMTCNLTSSTLTFTIKKYSGSYQNTGNAYIKDGGVCGDIISNNGNEVSFAIGATKITLTVPNNLSVGQTKTYYGIVLSNNNPSVNRFYTLPITIKRNQ